MANGRNNNCFICSRIRQWIILDKIWDIKDTDKQDKPCWMVTSSGKLTVNSSRDLLMHRAPVLRPFMTMWVKGVPFKMPFFLWRIWKFKLPLDCVIGRMVYMVISRCWCFPSPQKKYFLIFFFIAHLLLECGSILVMHWVYKVFLGNFISPY